MILHSIIITIIFLTSPTTEAEIYEKWGRIGITRKISKETLSKIKFSGVLKPYEAFPLKFNTTRPIYLKLYLKDLKKEFEDIRMSVIDFGYQGIITGFGFCTNIGTTYFLPTDLLRGKDVEYKREFDEEIYQYEKFKYERNNGEVSLEWMRKIMSNKTKENELMGRMNNTSTLNNDSNREGIDLRRRILDQFDRFFTTFEMEKTEVIAIRDHDNYIEDGESDKLPVYQDCVFEDENGELFQPVGFFPVRLCHTDLGYYYLRKNVTVYAYLAGDNPLLYRGWFINFIKDNFERIFRYFLPFIFTIFVMRFGFIQRIMEFDVADIKFIED